jgi:HNH endonuclease
VAELYLAGLSGLHRDRGAAYQALSFTERLVVWDGESEASRAAEDAAAAQRESDRSLKLAEADARQRRRETERAQFRAAYPEVDIDSQGRPSGLAEWLPGQECWRCNGACDSPRAVAGRCLGDEACRFRYRASLFMRQQGLCGWCGEPLNADLKRMHVDHVMPVSRRGPSADWNFQLLHGRCNTAKGPRLTDRAYDLAAEHGFVIPDFIAVWEQPVSGRKYGLRPKDRAVHWRPATGPVHLVHPGLEGTTLCGFTGARGWPQVTGEHGKPWNATCDHCRERRQILGPGVAPAYPALPY